MVFSRFWRKHSSDKKHVSERAVCKDEPPKSLVKCPKCETKIRLPANKHGFVSCPSCSARFEADTRVQERSSDADESDTISKVNKTPMPTDLMQAAWQASDDDTEALETLEQMCRNGADPNQQSGSQGIVPLLRTFDKPEATRILLKYGADPNLHIASLGASPLELALADRNHSSNLQTADTVIGMMRDAGGRSREEKKGPLPIEISPDWQIRREFDHRKVPWEEFVGSVEEFYERDLGRLLQQRPQFRYHWDTRLNDTQYLILFAFCTYQDVMCPLSALSEMLKDYSKDEIRDAAERIAWISVDEPGTAEMIRLSQNNTTILRIFKYYIEQYD